MDELINIDGLNEIAKNFEELSNIFKKLQNQLQPITGIDNSMMLSLDKIETVVKRMPKNMLNEIRNLNTLNENLSNLQQLCLLKYLPYEVKNDKIDKRLNKISKRDAENLFNSNLEYDVDENRFYKNNEIIGLHIVKKCVKASSFFDDITASELMDFLQYCYKTPLLASKHEVGKKFIQLVKN